MIKIYFAQNNPRGRFNRVENKKKHRTNEEIRIREVRLIDQSGDMVGIVSGKEALRRAEAAKLDLVEIAPKAIPPVCRIINYGKFVYDLQKKEKQQKKSQVKTQLKEIRFKWRTDTHDYNFKTRHARDFLEAGNKVKGLVMFRGREITHQEIGRKLLQRFIDDLADVSKIDSRLRMEGRNLSVILSPGKTKVDDK